MYRDVFSAHIQSTSRIDFTVQMVNGMKYSMKATQGKEMDFNPAGHVFYFLKRQLRAKRTINKQQLKKYCSKGLAKNLKGGNSAYDEVSGFPT